MAPIVPRQTILALYIQLHEAGHPNKNLLAVQSAYRIAGPMFSGSFRANEKPFLCHLVGTASAIAQVDRRVEMIIAGLLHAAYDLGVFPDGRIGGDSPEHRQWLADKVGTDVATLVARYNKFKFLPAHVERLATSYTPDDDRDIVKLRLCNEIDDLAEGGLTFATKYGEVIGPHAQACAILAERIGEPEIARTLLSLGRMSDEMAWTASLRPEAPRGHRVVPNLRAYLRLRRPGGRGRAVKVF